MPLKIIATPCRGHELKPGDLFSTHGPTFWDNHDLIEGAIGQRLYVRTETPATEAPDFNELVYRITIER